MARHGRVHQAYLAQLEEFQFWCSAEGLPFKWAMIMAMKRFQGSFDPDRDDADSRIGEFIERIKKQPREEVSE